MCIAHQDQKALLEKMEAVRAELDEERVALEKLRRESNLKAEQDRSNINTLRDQVTRLTSKMEDMRYIGFYTCTFLNCFLIWFLTVSYTHLTLPTIYSV